MIDWFLESYTMLGQGDSQTKDTAEFSRAVQECTPSWNMWGRVLIEAAKQLGHKTITPEAVDLAMNRMATALVRASHTVPQDLRGAGFVDAEGKIVEKPLRV